MNALHYIQRYEGMHEHIYVLMPEQQLGMFPSTKNGWPHFISLTLPTLFQPDSRKKKALTNNVNLNIDDHLMSYTCDCYILDNFRGILTTNSDKSPNTDVCSPLV